MRDLTPWVLLLWAKRRHHSLANLIVYAWEGGFWATWLLTHQLIMQTFRSDQIESHKPRSLTPSCIHVEEPSVSFKPLECSPTNSTCTPFKATESRAIIAHPLILPCTHVEGMGLSYLGSHPPTCRANISRWPSKESSSLVPSPSTCTKVYTHIYALIHACVFVHLYDQATSLSHISRHVGSWPPFTSSSSTTPPSFYMPWTTPI